MASPVAASPMLAPPSAFSPSTGSPSTSTRSSPRSSGTTKAPRPSPDTCAMILSWLRTAVPAILQANGHRTRRSKSEDPTESLAATLNDGVVLADLVAFLDPIRLPPASINRGTPRNALSLPVHSQSPPQSPSNIDSRQKYLQYKNNTRRVIAAVKQVLEDVRSYSGFPHYPPAGAVDTFLGDVSAVPPRHDLRPTIRLAELVIATAVYGRRHNEFRHSIWRFPTDSTSSAFHVAMSSVAEAVALPPPDVLYAAGPPPPLPIHSPGVMSPRSQPSPLNVLSPQHRVSSPRPPLSPHHPLSPLTRSPRAAFIPNPVLNPHAVRSPGQIATSHTPGTPPTPRGRHKPSSSHRNAPSPQQTSRNASRSSPKSGSRSQQPLSPTMESSRRSKSSSSSAPSSQSQTPSQDRSPRTSTTSSRKPSVTRSSTRNRTRSPSPTLGNVAESVAPLARTCAHDAKSAPLSVENAQARVVTQSDDGMCGRKFSMVTNESMSPRDANIRGDGSDSFGGLRTAASVARRVVETEYVQTMSEIRVERRVKDRQSREQTSPSDEQTSPSEDRAPDSKRSSDEFYTPNELSPDQSPSNAAPSSQAIGAQVLSPNAQSKDDVASPAISEIYMDSKTDQFYKDTKVDEKVRQSVTSSITEQISRGPTFGEVQQQAKATLDSRNIAPQLFRSESTTSSVDLKDSSYMLSPSTSDVPSPSNQWQISHQKGVGQDILSPLPMFSPPAMPRRHSRTAMATQVTPPIGVPPGPPLFRPGVPSPQLSVSSTGAQSIPDSMEQRQLSDLMPLPAQARRSSEPVIRSRPQNRTRLSSSSSNASQGLPPRHPKSSSVLSSLMPKHPVRSSPPVTQSVAGKSRVSFAPTIISPGGHSRPLGQPLRAVETVQSRSIASSSNNSSTPFSLPPSAADDESEKDIKSPEEEDDDDNNGEVERHDIHIRNDNDRSDDNHEDHDDHEDEDEHEDHDDREDDDGQRFLSRESSYYTARQSSEEVDSEHQYDPRKEDGTDSGDERETSVEKVEEYVYNSDDEGRGKASGGSRGIEASDSEAEGDAFHGEPDDDDGVFDEDEEYVDDSGLQDNDDVSPRDDDEDVEPAAEDEFPAPRMDLRGEQTDPVLAAEAGSSASNHPTVKDDVKTRNGFHEERLFNYIPSADDFITPPVATRYSRSARNASRFKEVPPTPPTPPDINQLMESISQSNLAEGGNDSGEEDDGPVSTMEPSAGLFQKLIAVWQSADKQGRRPEDLLNSSKAIGASSLFVPEVTLSHTTAIDSVIPSSNTEADREQNSLIVGESTRSHRPRAMRLPPAALSSPAYNRDVVDSEKRDEAEEGTSMASFSDAFSSDDKDRVWSEQGPVHSEGPEWEEALKGDSRAGLPLSPSDGTDQAAIGESEGGKSTEEGTEPEAGPSHAPPRPRKAKSYSFVQGHNGVITDGQHVKVDRRRLDWLTRELLAARDAISRKELQMTFAETQRLEQEEILTLRRQDAESVVEAMKKILTERESELRDARNRLSVAIQSGPSGESDRGITTATGPSQRVSVESRSSNAGGNLEKLITEGHAKLYERFDECNAKHAEAAQTFSHEMKGLWNEVQRGMAEKMMEMTEKRDAELDALRRELANREHLIMDMKQSSSDLVDQNRAIQAEASELRLQKEKTAHRYELEMSHVTAQVELVNEFSKKLHDNFRETENLRQQVLQYQDKLSHIASTSGVSQRQIKELREAVTRANDECARLRREADFAKKKGMEAVRRAEELEELRFKDAAAHSAGRFPDRQDSGSFRSHEPVRPAGHNRPGGAGINTRYHGTTRGRGVKTGHTPAQKTWILIKDKISGIVTGKESGTSRRRAPGHHRDMMRGAPGSQSSRSQTRSRVSRDDDISGRSRTASQSSNGSESVGGSSIPSGPQRSNRSGVAPRSGTSGGSGDLGGAVPMGNIEDEEPFIQTPGTYGKGEVGRLRASDF